MSQTQAQPYAASWPEDIPLDAAPTRPRGFVPFFIGVFVWSFASAFSHFITTEENAHFVSAVGLALAIAFIGLAWLYSLYAWLLNLTGLLVALHALVALFSAVANEAHPLAAVRYLLLIPAMSMMIAAVRMGDRAVAGARAGITLAGVIFCLYQFSALDFGSLLNPQYRLFTFLNPNGVGFIAAMTGISLLDYAITRYSRHRRVRPAMMIFLAGVVVSLLLCIATKSRTATLVFLMGSMLRLYLLFGPTRTILIGTVLSILAVTVAWDSVAAAGETVAEVFQLHDKHRAIEKGTGRFQIWGTVVEEIWLPNPWLGVGPMRHLALTEYYAKASSAHNGLLAILADTGILGTAPIVILLVICARRAFASRRDPTMAFAISLFVGGLLESMAENMFFSMGNPGSILFLLSIAVLSVRGPGKTNAPVADQSHRLDEAQSFYGGLDGKPAG